MRYFVNNEEVSRDTFYFCQKAKEENKTFVLLDVDTFVGSYINQHPEYDYYIRDGTASYYTKGNAIVTAWYEKDKYYNWSKCTIDDMWKRYEKSKFKDIMLFEEWYTKNGWVLKSETKYAKECHDIPTVEDFYEEVQIKLFSVKVNNDDTVKTINEMKEKYGDCIEYVLRGCYTEIIYRDSYLEI